MLKAVNTAEDVNAQHSYTMGSFKVKRKRKPTKTAFHHVD